MFGRKVAFDTETFSFGPGLQVPRTVCLTYRVNNGQPRIETNHDNIRNLLLDWLLDNDTLLIGAMTAYDAATLAENYGLLDAFFAAYDADRITDIQIREKLKRIEAGGLSRWSGAGDDYLDDPFEEEEITHNPMDFSLAGMSSYYLGKDRSADKSEPDAWRYRYAELYGIPVDEWPTKAIEYALEDADDTMEIYLRQSDEPWPDEYRQARASIGLYLTTAWGLRTDGEAVKALAKTCNDKRDAIMGYLLDEGIYKFKTKKAAVARDMTAISKDTKNIAARVEAVYESKGLIAPLTPSGRTQTDKEALQFCSSDPALAALSDLGTYEKIRTTYLPALELGIDLPINAAYDVVKATGRTSSYRPNIQNPPRVGGVRECFVARPGTVFCSVDYNYIELCTLAQSCLDRFGRSVLADVINKGIDPHVMMAASIYSEEHGERVSAEDFMVFKKTNKHVFKQYRQMAKAANFGFPGGMGAKKFVKYAKIGYNVDLTEGQVKKIKQLWLATFPEMNQHFASVSWACNLGGGECSVTLPRSKRKRGACKFTNACNYYFQGPAADGAKRAIYRFVRESLIEPWSPVYGSRLAIFLHDELVTEIPEDRADASARRLTEIMLEEMKFFVPDVKIAAEPALMRRWYKGAEAVYVDGKLVPWEPEVPDESK